MYIYTYIYFINIYIKYIYVYILPEDGHRSGPKHVVSSAQ
jgi:hypothetical protein